MDHDKEMFTLVKRIAWSIGRRIPPHIPMDDLIGAGALGLAEAYQRRGTMTDDQFSAYAATRIRGAIIDELRRIDPLSRPMRRIAKKLEAAVAQAGSSHSEAEVAAAHGVSASTLTCIRGSRSRGNAPRLSLVPAPNGSSPEDLACKKQSLARAERATEKLTGRMREIMKAKYEDDETQRDIALRLGVTEARISQLHTVVLRRLAALAEECEVA